jgi:tetratricopeptide (TPR) repeat protein
MKKEVSYSPILYDYLRRYQQDPTSRVFAPLAEAYRKAGMLDQAVEIAREGLRVHPNFLGGRVALARALFDQKKYEEVVAELARVIEDAPDNLVAQRLLADSYLVLGKVPEALSCLKMLLYFNPGEKETAALVQELESQAYDRGVMVLREDPETRMDPFSQFSIRGLSNAIEEDPIENQAKKKVAWIRRIEKLQKMLQQVERYRSGVSTSSAPGQ